MRVGKGVIAVIAATACAMTMTAAPAFAGDSSRSGHGHQPPTTVVTSGLTFPLQLAAGQGRSLLVTQAGLGEVSQVDIRSGATKPVVTGVPHASGATRIGNKIAIVTGEDGSPPIPGEPPRASLLVAKPYQAAVQFADLGAFELANNPDGQTQFSPEGDPYDALSNPFAVLPDRGRGYAIVSDGGANDVLKVNARGEVSAFFVPPLVTSGECATRPNNGDDPKGCDPVATGMAYGPGNSLYVATLSGEAAGEGRVYVLDARTARVKKVIRGFNSPTGVAVDDRGNVYVSELLDNDIVKVDCRGRKTFADIASPSAVFFTGGKLYSTANAFAPGAGQILQVNDSAFDSTTRPAPQEPPAEPSP